MKFGIFFELQIPRPWDEDSEFRVFNNALEQAECIYATMKQFEGTVEGFAAPSERRAGPERADRVRDAARTPSVMFTSEAGIKPLTKREREVLALISDGHSNKQGALRMRISPRTFESHRAEAMRKLGARNTAELVHAALKHPGEC